MTKDNINQTEEKPLTEWQKRNLEYLKKREQDHKEFLGTQAKLDAIKQQKKGIKTKASKTDGPTVPVKKVVKQKKRISKSHSLAFKLSLGVFLLAMFMISPLSKLKHLTISGQKNASESQVVKASKITEDTYTSDLFIREKYFTDQIKKNVDWVDEASITYHFPFDFKVSVKEFDTVGYKESKDGFYPVLSNGNVLSSKAQDIENDLMVFNISDDTMITAVVQELSKLNPSLNANISQISKVDSKSTSDLILLETSDGHLIRVPLSQLVSKLGHYNDLVGKLPVGSIIDMEVGIYATNADIELAIEATKNPVETTTETSAETKEVQDASAESTEISQETSSEIVTEPLTSGGETSLTETERVTSVESIEN